MTKVIDVPKTVAVQRRPGAQPEIHFAVPGLKSTISLPNVVKEHASRLIRPAIRDQREQLRGEMDTKIGEAETRVSERITDELRQKGEIEDFDRVGNQLRLKAYKDAIDEADAALALACEETKALRLIARNVWPEVEAKYQLELDAAEAASDAASRAYHKRVEDARREASAAEARCRSLEKAARKGGKAYRVYSAALDEVDRANEALRLAEDGEKSQAPMAAAREMIDGLHNKIADEGNAAVKEAMRQELDALARERNARARYWRARDDFDNAIVGTSPEEDARAAVRREAHRGRDTAHEALMEAERGNFHAAYAKLGDAQKDTLASVNDPLCAAPVTIRTCVFQ